VGSSKLQSLEEWVAKAKPATRCAICRRPSAAHALRVILETIVAHKAFRISMPKILDRLNEQLGAEFTYSNLEKHLSRHERTLWEKSRGR
jgi:hypothetical protein